MIGEIVIEPCPFCHGQAYPAVTDLISDDSISIDLKPAKPTYLASVWCHECGAEGPEASASSLSTFEYITDLTVIGLAKIAVERWNDRGAKNKALYDAAIDQGLNVFHFVKDEGETT